MIDATAEVDFDTGRIVLPVERYYLSPEEDAQVRDAARLVFQKCAAEKGDVFEWSPEPADQGSDRRYGVWRLDKVAKFGYDLDWGTSASNPAPVAGAEPDAANVELTPAEYEARMKIVEECQGAPDAQKLRIQDVSLALDYPAEFQWITEAVFESDQGVAVFDEWEACLGQKGLERDQDASPFAIRGATLDINESNIKIAVADVECKDEVHFVQRLADLEAAKQAPVVARFSKELSVFRADQEVILKFAQEYLAANAP